MKIIKLVLAALAGAGAGCATAPSAPRIAISDLPNCFQSNFDAQRRLFTIRNLNDIWANPTKNPANQQCLLTVAPSGGNAAASGLTAGKYIVYVTNGGGGGAGGTMESPLYGVAGGGGGGGGAGAKEMRATVHLTEGIYKLTIGAGGPGGRVCGPTLDVAGGPGWAGSPSNVVRVLTGEVVAGVAGADAYVRPTIYQHEQLARIGRPGQGGFGPGQTSGGAGARPESASSNSELAKAGTSTGNPVQPNLEVAFGFLREDFGRPNGAGRANDATAAAKGRSETPSQTDIPSTRNSLERSGGGAARSEPIYTPSVEPGAGTSELAADGTGAGGAPGFTYGPGYHPSGGGGGGATNAGDGGGGGGENLRHRVEPPVPGSLGSGGGGGAGNTVGCDPGARGGNGYIAFRRTGAAITSK